MEDNNGGDILWDPATHIWELEGKEDCLRKHWVEHKQKIAEEVVDSASENTSTSTTVWRRPEIKLCTVQLKLFPRATEGAGAKN
jgi:hypothetical protein